MQTENQRTEGTRRIAHRAFQRWQLYGGSGKGIALVPIMAGPNVVGMAPRWPVHPLESRGGVRRKKARSAGMTGKQYRRWLKSERAGRVS